MSLALRRAAGAVGGTAGALPLLAVARELATQLAVPPRLPGRELLAGDVKAATYAELAVLVLVLPAAAFFFGRILPDRIRALGGFVVALPGIAFALSALLWRRSAAPGTALAAGAAAAALVALTSVLLSRSLGLRRDTPSPPREELAPGKRASSTGNRPTARVGVAFLGLAILFAAAVRFSWRPHAPVDLFESGHMLAAAQVYLAGGAPFRDTYPVHGWGADGGVDAAVFRVFEPTLAVFRARHAVGAGLSVVAVALASWALFRRFLWSAAAFILALSLCPYMTDRQAPAFLALAALVWAAESGSRRAHLAAGAAAAATVFYALDFGVLLVIAAFLTIASLGAFERSGRAALRAAVWFSAGAAAGALPFVAYLAARGVAGDFASVSFLELPGRISDIWSVPAPAVAPLFARGSAGDLFAALLRGQGVPWLFHAAVYALAATVLLFRAARGVLSPVDRGAVAATWTAIVAMRGVLGRADDGHQILYGLFVALPAAWLLYRAARAAHAPWLWAPLLAFALTARIEPYRLPWIWRYGLAYSGPAAAECYRPVERGGGATVPCAQDDEIDALRGWMDRELTREQTFFDYGNEPALYFLLDRRPPIRYCCVPFYEGEDYEREVIEALEREKPPLAILASGTSLDAFDDVASRVRTPRVAEYLDRHYTPAGKVGSRTLGRRKPPA